MIDHEPALLQTLKQHRSDINSCDFSCASLLATASADKTVRLWNWQPGLGYVETEYSPLRCHKYGVTCVRFSPQGTMVASSSIEGTSKVHAVRDGVMTHCLTQPSGIGVRVCRFAPDSCILATGADDGMICIWDLLQKNIIRCVSYHEGAVQALSFTADGTMLLGACTQGVLSVFSVEELLDSNTSNTQPCITIDDAHDLGVLAMDLSPIIQEDDSSSSGVRIHQVVTSGHDQLIRLWELRVKSTKTTPTATLDLQNTMLGHTSAITCVRFSSDGDLIASACLDRTVRIWSKTGRYRTIHAHARYVNCVAFSKDGTLIATGSNDKTVNIWDVRGNLSLDSELVKPCTKLSHFGAGDLVGIGPAEGALADLVSSRAEVQHLVSDLNTHALAVNGVCFAGDHTLATACSDKLIRLFHWSDLEGTLEELSVSPLVGHKYAATAVHFTADGSALFSCSLDGTAILWDVESGERLVTLGVGASGGARAVAVSPSRTAPLLIAAGDDALTPMWRLGEDEEPFVIFSGHADAITCVAFSSDGCALVSASQCGDFRLYRAPERDLNNPSDKQIYMQTNAHDLGVLSCDFCPSPETLSPAPDVQILATSGNDSLAKMWILTIPKTTERVEVRLWRELVGHGGSVTCVRFEPGIGNLLTTGATDKQTRVWCASTGRCMHVVSHKSGIGTCAISSARLLAVGCLDGSLHLHRLPPPSVHEMRPDTYRSNSRAVVSWSRQDVDRWITDNCAIGSQDLEEITWLEQVLSRAKQHEVNGSYLLSHTEDEILETLGIDGSSGSIRAQNFLEELHWVKSKPKTVSTPSDPPHQYLCPITHQLMTDPVKCADGFTYERSAIYEWFLSGGKLVSPMTNQALLNHSVSPNFELRRSIRQYLQAPSENPDAGNAGDIL